MIRSSRALGVAASLLAATGCVPAAPPVIPMGPPIGMTVPQSKPGKQGRKQAPKESPRSFKLFDQEHTTQAFEFDLGPVWYRQAKPTRDDFERGTGEILAGVTTSTTWKPFYLTGLQQTHVRVFGAKEAAWTLLASHIAAGLVLGPIEPEVRIGVGWLTADVFRGDYSIQLLTPRVAAGVGVHVGKIRLDFQAHTEYLWRWFGPDYQIRGFSVGLRFDAPKPKLPTFGDGQGS